MGVKNITDYVKDLESAVRRTDQLSLLIGTMIGQISELLNGIKNTPMTNDMIYRSLFDIHTAAGLQIHELYYKENKKEIK